MSTLRITLALMICLACRSGAAPLELRKGDVVAFVGGTDMVRMQKDGTFEATLALRFREAAPKFRDLAWEGDTVYFQSTVRERWRREAFGDWSDQLKRVGATVVVAQFGKMESLDGRGRLDDFKAAYSNLIDVFGADGRRVILLAPSPPEWDNADRRAFPEYTRAVEALAQERGLIFADLAAAGAGGQASPQFVEAVRQKHQLWYDYWRPANWKCLFGDDSRRVFSNAAEGLPSFKQEWSTFPELIAAAEAKLYDQERWQPAAPPVRTGSGEADTAKELASFEVADGYEINLFADESHGIANPLSVRWAADGTMYVACSDTYPQIEPGVVPDDKVYALRDTDGDGKADESKVFAAGLSIPTGMEVGHDGVYVGQNTELLLFGWDGERKLLLSGFGNGDSHQTINSFVWSPGGELWFCQGDGVESRVETPFGVSSLFQAGVFRLRPRELRLDGLLDDFMGPGNPWGVAFDDFGQAFVIDGAGGISYLTPGSIPANRRLRLPRIGQPGGYCGVECLGDDVFVVGDYKKNQVSRYVTVEDGGGFKVDWRAPLLRSKHRNFRPIDVKLGPDGAIYVVDWYNPITCHQDDFYRHPARDKTHGRIWRVARRGSDSKPPRLAEAPTSELLEALKSPQRWTRLKAKQVLAARGLTEVPAVVRTWKGRDLLEAVSLLEYLDIPDRAIAEQLLRSDDHRARAYAARVVGRWGKRLDDPHALLEIAAGDPHPRVRMEAVLACAHIPEARSVLVAATVAEGSRDRWIDYAFAQAVHHLKPHWLAAFRRGELDFGDRSRGLAAVLGQADSKALLAELRRLLQTGAVEGEGKAGLVKALLAVGEEGDVRLALQLNPPSAAVLRSLAKRERPDFDVVEPLRVAIRGADETVRIAGLEVVSRWGVNELSAEVRQVVERAEAGGELRGAAIRTFGTLGGEGAIEPLKALASSAAHPEPAALAALLDIDPDEASRAAARMLRAVPQPEFIREVFAEFVAREGGGRLLAKELGGADIGRAQGQRLHQQWIATGLVDADLARQLDDLAGVAPAGVEFSESLVKEMVAASRQGDAARGAELFRSARAGCVACHKVGELGGTIGPDLSAVGSGVPLERIVTEVVWPARQVKEGYSLSRVTMVGGRVLQGYVQENRNERVLLLRDFASGELHELATDEVAKREVVGSLMPPTAQSLTRAEQADLVHFLSQLRGQE